MTHHYTVIFDREVDGRHIASVPGVPGCHAYGRTSGEALKKVKKALAFYLRENQRVGGKPPRQPRPLALEITIAA